ncbi:hypothetical protein KKF84_21800 [Myxococcota bacterium]|nr:hypothetical protein [Myxococcota bacterium]MBU1537962.1 hypothetical protein [Myxococcota bacterium]
MDNSGRPPFPRTPHDEPVELSRQNMPGGGTLELGSFDSTLEATPVQPRQDTAPRPGTGNSLQLALVEDDTYFRTITPPEEQNTIKDPQPEEVSPVEVVTEDPQASLGVDARALSSGAYTGPMVARRQSTSPWESFRNSFIAMTLAGAILGLLIGGGVTTYYTRSALSKDVKTVVEKREVAQKGAVLLNDSKNIDELDQQEKSARSSIAIKGSLLWSGIFGIFLFLWIRFIV